MQYRDFGKTGKKISALGFGSMRLPMVKIDDKNHVDYDKAIQILRHAFENGVNYVDTAYFYCEGESEIAVGRALKDGWREKMMLSTKYPVRDYSDRSNYRSVLEDQLRKLDTDCIDFYHFHGINKNVFDNIIIKNDLLKEAIKCKEEGLINHISFSFHDKPENMKYIIDVGEVFESVLCQYNLLDRSNEDSIDYARSKGLGVVAMGPVAGGRLSMQSEVISSMLKREYVSTPEMALRFVLANHSIDCALSGMGNMDMVKQNLKVANIETPLTDEETKQIKQMMEENKRLSELYCTGCNYCMPCPKGIKIPDVFSAMNYYKVYGLVDLAKERFAKFGKSERDGANPADCIQCGACEKKCPQKIKIREQLKETISALAE